MELDTKLDMNQGECSTSGTVDVDQIVRSVRKRLDHYRSQDDIRHKERNLLCIIKEVSKHIREVDSNSYEPIIVSIGPKHYGKPALQAMEREKWDCLDYILKLNPGQKLYDYLHGLEEVGAQAKLYYLEGSMNDFVPTTELMPVRTSEQCGLGNFNEEHTDQHPDASDQIDIFETSSPPREEQGKLAEEPIQAMCSHNDVTLLSQKGIVVHQMRTDEEVSILFGKIGKNVDFDPNGRYYLKYICEALEEHYRSRLNRWMAWLWQNHFSNPWLSLAVVAGAIVGADRIALSIAVSVPFIHGMQTEEKVGMDGWMVDRGDRGRRGVAARRYTTRGTAVTPLRAAGGKPNPGAISPRAKPPAAREEPRELAG
ncbi:hypothetical protein EJB05_15698, partial [Eragrostis curvula]